MKTDINGEYDEILFAKDASYSTSELWKYFVQEESWQGKPKLYFIQACRGHNYTEGSKQRKIISMEKDTSTTSAGEFRPEDSSQFIHPDLFMFCATLPGTYSFRTGDSTTFGENLNLVFQEYYQTWDLISMATKVCQKVAEEFEATGSENLNSQQMPCFMSTLGKTFRFSNSENLNNNCMIYESSKEKKFFAKIFSYSYAETDRNRKSAAYENGCKVKTALEYLGYTCEQFWDLNAKELKEKCKQIIFHIER